MKPDAPLTVKQKAALCQLARRAWRFAGSPGDATEWRREQQLKACGHESLTEATQSDYISIRAHFEDMCGSSGRALNTLLSRETEQERMKRGQALYILQEHLRKTGLHTSYADAICLAKYKCPVAAASTGQIWQVFFTCRNRRKAKRAA